MNTVFMLGLTDYPEDLCDTFALNDADLGQIALDNYHIQEDGLIQVEVRPADAHNKVRLSMDGDVVTEYYIFRINRVSR